MRCGETDVIVLEFDHLPEFDKIADISTLVSKGVSNSRIQEEINKCQVLCANDHRRVTAERGGFRSIENANYHYGDAVSHPTVTTTVAEFTSIGEK